MGNFLSKRKQDEPSVEEVRSHQVKVMLNDEELRLLDDIRGRLSRAEVLRYLLMNKMPPAIPALNQTAWTELSRASANLNQLVRHLNTGGALDVEQIIVMLDQLRAALIGAAK
ncbi:plasmid mobilization relaxosome protein MobC [Sideroxydans sp.]